MSHRLDRMVVKCFGHVECMAEERLNERIRESDAEGTRDTGRPCTRWLVGVKEV